MLSRLASTGFSRLQDQGSDQTITLAAVKEHVIALGVLVALSIVIVLLTRLIVMPLLRRAIKRTNFEWDDVFLDANTFKWLSDIPAAIVFALGTQILHSEYIPWDFTLSPDVMNLLAGLAYAFIVVCVLMAINASLTAFNAIYERREDAKNRPIKGFIQLAKIFVFVVGSICATALAFGQAPWEFLKYTAGMTAILMFVFKDTILSAIASIQLTQNKMLQLGDWIEVPSCAADGDVIDIALHTVKVQNFDKTIVTVPTQKLVDGAFRNWRGMSESGGRRIKRDIHLDLSTVRFLTDEDIERFEKIDILKDYMAEKREALASAGQSGVDQETPLNSRHLTNLGTFRAYVARYLKSLPNVHGAFTFLVRQLQAGPTGVPIQVYIFLDTTAWVTYENVQGDIFDHLLAAVPQFGLRVYQQPSSYAIESLSGVIPRAPAG